MPSLPPGSLYDMTLQQLGLVSKHNSVVTVPWDRPALDCFKLMHEKRVSAVVGGLHKLNAGYTHSLMKGLVSTLEPIK